MPLYTYKCQTCKTGYSAFRRIINREIGPECCGLYAQKQIDAPRVQADVPGYESPIDGTWIEGASARRQDLARSGSIPYDPEMKTDYLNRLKNEDKAIDKFVDNVVSDVTAAL